MLQLNIQLKQEYCDVKYTPQETAYWIPALQASAVAIQQMNILFAKELVDGTLPSNPESETIEGFLGDCNTPPNELGVVTIVIDKLTRLKIPYIPEGMPFILYLGDDATEQKEVGVDEKTKEPIYETIYAGSLL